MLFRLACEMVKGWSRGIVSEERTIFALGIFAFIKYFYLT